ncbi:protein NLRC5-like isoform X1 [Dendronephthya gigantea]|uniref:protein NLRC5-like isoform X1 n=1 Tax=Dendronephthya gigantea TaxID=151771 RepID=UPI00106D8F93|nr:protein NLRC5-like isoform X1 [Dendronephthya gigantea]
MTNNNYREPNTKKRGRPASKLSVRLFLLDPDTVITKVTKDTCSKTGIEALMQRGYGPPPKEHCVKDDKVEFTLDLTNEQFKQKLIQIYPKLENAFFVFMKANKTNTLEELNPGLCCFRCYTPENVYNSERGQGRLYMRIIAENEISPCTHGIPRTKKLRGMVGGGQQFFVPILPKPASTLTTGDVVTSAVTPNNGLTESSQSGSTSTQSQLSSSTITSITPLADGSVDFTTHGPPLSVVSPTTPGLPSSQTLLSTSNISQPVNSDQLTRRPISMSIVPQVGLAPTPQNQGGILVQRPLQTPLTVSSVTLTPFLQNSVNIASQSQFLSPSVISGPSQPAQDSNVLAQRQLPISTAFITGNTAIPAIQNPGNFVNLGQLESLGSGSMTPQGQFSRSAGVHDVHFLQSMPGTQPFNQTVADNDLDSQWRALGEAMVLASQNPVLMSTSTVPSSLTSSTLPPLRSAQSPGLNTLLDAIMQHEQNAESPSSGVINSNVQGHVNLPEPNELRIKNFLENVESTKKLTISLAVLDDDLLLKRLKESTIEIHTIEIHSRCEVHKVLNVYSLPSCLKILRIINNVLNFDDIYFLKRCFSTENSLQELDLSRTKFEENSFHSFISVLMNRNDLTRLILTDNCLTKHEISSLLESLKCMTSLKNVDLSKNNLSVFEIHGQLHNIVSLDLSHSALQGDTSIIEICKLQSLEEINLSHNHIRFFSLSNFDTKPEKLSINMKNISLSFNYMTPEDISRFCCLIRSNLTKLELDFNHIGNSIWALCSLDLRFLKVLSLANTDVCVAVDGLAFLLSLVQELEELNLSSNNLVLDDFRQLQSPLSNLMQLKKLNLSNNPEGASALLQEILSSFKYLQELRLSDTHMNGEDFGKISNSLASLRDLKYLDLSVNAIDSDGTRTLANLLKGFLLLEGLDLGQSFMTGSDLNVLWNSFVSLKVLKYLNLSGNQVDTNAFDNSLLFPASLEEFIISNVIHSENLFMKMLPLKNLKKLHLIDMRLRACDVEALATMLSSFSMLEEISLARTVADSNIEKIFSAIKRLPNIKIIDLSGVKLPDVDALVDMLSSLLSLEELVLARICIDNIDHKKIIDALVLLKSLRILNLHWAKKFGKRSKVHRTGICFEDVEDTKQLCSGLEKIRYLKELSLYFGDPECINHLAEVLPSLHLLERFVLESEYIIISDKHTVGKLFSALGRLMYLRDLEFVLYFKIVGIVRNILKALAQMLSSLLLLEKLVFDLTFDWYEDEDGDYKSEIQLVTTALGKLKNLRELRLSGVLSGEGIVEVLASLPLLERLMLRFKYDCKPPWCNNNIEYEEKIFHSLVKVSYLKQLFIYDTPVSPDLVEVLPSLRLLETLCFELNDHDEETLSLSLGELKYLRELHLKGFDINEQTLFNGSRSFYLLEKIKISCYELSVVKQRFPYLGKLRHLKQLTLYCYEFFDNSLLPIASLSSLEKIKLNRTYFDTDDNAKQLFALLLKVRSLKKLSLDYSGRHSTQVGIDALAEALPAMKFLETLSLDCINFTKVKGEQQLMTAIGSLSFLKKLDLFCSSITQAGTETLTVVLPNLYNLRRFTLPRFEIQDFTQREKLKEDLRRVVPWVIMS